MQLTVIQRNLSSLREGNGDEMQAKKQKYKNKCHYQLSIIFQVDSKPSKLAFTVT